ncbi:MAG: helix-turn-helix transcriptional regulator [Firmicutes bacterium]|nr:helix-turn-helix transcriptional regulator [Bacillota bacterium]
MSYDQMCPHYRAAIRLLGKKWTGMLLRVLLGGPRRFSDFRRQIPDLSDRLLAERLKELEEHGIVSRVVHGGRPIVVEYRLTEKGRELAPVVEAIQAWADRWY